MLLFLHGVEHLKKVYSPLAEKVSSTTEGLHRPGILRYSHMVLHLCKNAGKYEALPRHHKFLVSKVIIAKNKKIIKICHEGLHIIEVQCFR